MLEAVRHAIGADTLGYISQQGMIAATEQPASRLCSACFDGKYPIELPGETALGKNVIEHMLATAARTGIPHSGRQRQRLGAAQALAVLRRSTAQSGSLRHAGRAATRCATASR